jgi:5-methylcytosine-specific restriction endonuclease McrA
MSAAIPLPFHISELSPRRLIAFKNFLNQSGAEIFSSPNAYEVVRFRAGQGMAVIYRNGAGRLKFVGPIAEPWRAFVSNLPYRATPRPGRLSSDRRTEIIAALIDRDGRRCFYCPWPLAEGFETIEHLVPATAGGPDHLANLALAHRSCNEGAGVLSLFEKIRLRERLHRAEPISAPRLTAAIDAALAGLNREAMP